MASTFKGRGGRSRSTLLNRPVLKQAVYRSRLEDRIAAQLEEAGCPFTYERTRHPYIIPARKAHYVEDFDLNEVFIVEAKGYFTPDDRKKLLLLKDQNPDLDIRLVFQRASNKLHKNSPTTYGKWCDDHGFKWADGGVIPQAWVDEAMQAKGKSDATDDHAGH